MIDKEDHVMKIQLEKQLNPIADEVSALIAIVRPILTAILYAVKREIIDELGGYDRISLKLLSRIYKPGDGDCGISFEYAVHDAFKRSEPSVTERIIDAMNNYCHLNGSAHSSILFGAEKNGALKLIDTAESILTDESLLLYGSKGRPAKLKFHIKSISAAFRNTIYRESLPYSLSGLWKADLFTGFTDTDRWLATTIKINPAALEPAKGLRVGIIPSMQGQSDSIFKDENKNLVVCPIPHDGAFMEAFYKSWNIVKQFIAADAKMPKEVNIPRPPERQVAQYLEDRRNFPVLEVIEALLPLAQPELLERNNLTVETYSESSTDYNKITSLIAPKPRNV